MHLVPCRLEIILPHTEDGDLSESYFISLKDFYFVYPPRIGETITTSNIDLTPGIDLSVTDVEHSAISMPIDKLFVEQTHLWIITKPKINDRKKTLSLYQFLVTNDSLKGSDRHWEYSGDS